MQRGKNHRNDFDFQIISKTMILISILNHFFQTMILILISNLPKDNFSQQS